VVALGPVAGAQSSELEGAEDRKDEADRLVLAAVADRDLVEAELVDALDRYQELSIDLAALGARLDRLQTDLARTAGELEVASHAAEEAAVGAYMEAVSHGGLILGTKSLEQVMVAQRTLQFMAGDEEDAVANLAVAERDFLRLQSRYSGELAVVDTLRADVETEAQRLQTLFIQADQAVALAIESALTADLEYRLELDAVARARAAEEERRRQEQRTTTTTVAGSSVTTTTVYQPRPLKPAVEQWRSLTAQFFAAELVEPALRIMQCESLGDPLAYNPYSGASGLFQFLPATWAVTSVKAGYDGASPFDPQANVASAAWLAGYYQSLGRSPWSPWHCQP
jgi:hypothetical protein